MRLEDHKKEQIQRIGKKQRLLLVNPEEKRLVTKLRKK